MDKLHNQLCRPSTKHKSCPMLSWLSWFLLKTVAIGGGGFMGQISVSWKKFFVCDAL